MKILLINNFHYHRGGAERAYFDIARILRQAGHEVAFFSTDHPKTIDNPWRKYFVKYYELGGQSRYSIFDRLKIVFRLFYKFETRRKLRKLLEEFAPDVAHLHNIFRHLTPSVIDELKKNKIPTVMTLHDFEIVSPNSNLFSQGKIWENGKNGAFYQCVREKCVHGSYLKSLIGATETYFHQWRNVFEKIDVFLSPSNFLIEKLREFGFKREIIKTENPVLSADTEDCDISKKEGAEDWLPKGDYISFVGRLSEEKGVVDLLSAFAKVKIDGLKLVVMGDGPQKAELVELADELRISQRAVFLDYDNCKHKAVQLGSLGLVSPSKCYENAPYGVLDALALKKTVICANIGGQKEIVQDGVNGLLFEPGNVQQLAEKIEQLVKDPAKSKLMAEKGYFLVRDKNGAQSVERKLIRAYELAIERSEAKVQEGDKLKIK